MTTFSRRYNSKNNFQRIDSYLKMIVRGSPESRTYFEVGIYSLYRPLTNRTVALAAAGAGVLVAFYAIWVASNPKPKVSEEGERAAPVGTAEASAAEKQRVAEEKAVTVSPGTGSKPVVTVAYGSQTGNAKAIAQDVFKKLREMGVKVRLLTLNDWKKLNPTLVKGTELLICVISTTGNADAPDNCDKFQRFLKRKALAADMLKGLRFAVLGLGDTNYNEFCYMGRWLDERLDGLGAKRFRPLGCADEATGLEDVVEPWCEALYPAVLKAIESGGGFGGGAEDSAPAAGGVGAAAEGIDMAVSAASAAAAAAEATPLSLVKARRVRPLSDFVAAETLAEVDEAVGLAKGRLHKSAGLGLYDVVFAAPPAASASDSASTLASSANAGNNGGEAEEEEDDDEKAFLAEVVAARYLTKGGKESDRRVVEATIALNNASSSALSLSYCVGDAVGLQCPNAPEDVEAMLYHLRRTHAAYTTTGNSFFATHGGGAAVKLTYAKDGAPAPLVVADAAQLLPSGSKDGNGGDGGGLGSCVLTVRDVLTWGVDLSAPLKPTLLAALAECCTSSEEAKALKLLAVKEAHSSDNGGASLSEAESFAYFVGSSAYGAFVSGQGLHLSELLELFPSCAAPLGLLVAALPPLSCRYYSIASSPAAGSGSSTDAASSTVTASIAFSVVEWSGSPTTSSGEGGVQRRGLCTGWLEDQLRPALQLPPFPSHFITSSSFSSSSFSKATATAEPCLLRVVCALKPATDFTLPADPSVPVIMIGPGTGVAPFIGFVQHRSLACRQSRTSTVHASVGEKKDDDPSLSNNNSSDFGPMLLYFGCRHKAQDWIYESEMKAYEKDGTLSRLRTAFSRDGDPAQGKCYVQHRLLEDAAELSRLIMTEGAAVFVCGAMHMAKDVHKALVKVVMTEPAPPPPAATHCKSEGIAEAFLEKLKHQGRYVQDIWG